jgi:hypothetical protein
MGSCLERLVFVGLLLVGHLTSPAPTTNTVLHDPELLQPSAIPSAEPTHAAPRVSWTSSEVSWYGKQFYGNRTACGQTYSSTIIGVAHKTLPCGTRVTFRYGGVTITTTVIDRGPYVEGRDFDLSRHLCLLLSHCFTGKLQWHLN